MFLHTVVRPHLQGSNDHDSRYCSHGLFSAKTRVRGGQKPNYQLSLHWWEEGQVKLKEVFKAQKRAKEEKGEESTKSSTRSQCTFSKREYLDVAVIGRV